MERKSHLRWLLCDDCHWKYGWFEDHKYNVGGKKWRFAGPISSMKEESQTATSDTVVHTPPSVFARYPDVVVLSEAIGNQLFQMIPTTPRTPPEAKRSVKPLQCLDFHLKLGRALANAPGGDAVKPTFDVGEEVGQLAESGHVAGEKILMQDFPEEDISKFWKVTAHVEHVITREEFYVTTAIDCDLTTEKGVTVVADRSACFADVLRPANSFDARIGCFFGRKIDPDPEVSQLLLDAFAEWKARRCGIFSYEQVGGRPPKYLIKFMRVIRGERYRLGALPSAPRSSPPSSTLASFCVDDTLEICRVAECVGGRPKQNKNKNEKGSGGGRERGVYDLTHIGFVNEAYLRNGTLTQHVTSALQEEDEIKMETRATMELSWSAQSLLKSLESLDSSPWRFVTGFLPHSTTKADPTQKQKTSSTTKPPPPSSFLSNSEFIPVGKLLSKPPANVDLVCQRIAEILAGIEEGGTAGAQGGKHAFHYHESGNSHFFRTNGVTTFDELPQTDSGRALFPWRELDPTVLERLGAHYLSKGRGQHQQLGIGSKGGGGGEQEEEREFEDEENLLWRQAPPAELLLKSSVVIDGVGCGVVLPVSDHFSQMLQKALRMKQFYLIATTREVVQSLHKHEAMPQFFDGDNFVMGIGGEESKPERVDPNLDNAAERYNCCLMENSECPQFGLIALRKRESANIVQQMAISALTKLVPLTDVLLSQRCFVPHLPGVFGTRRVTRKARKQQQECDVARDGTCYTVLWHMPSDGLLLQPLGAEEDHFEPLGNNSSSRSSEEKMRRRLFTHLPPPLKTTAMVRGLPVVTHGGVVGLLQGPPKGGVQALSFSHLNKLLLSNWKKWALLAAFRV